ncbi:hypothetical protein [Cryptosporidium parvum Iowa II]|uniref:Uncharacterized protein n=2 Tax=Cryptosporidium parvum TaxID=5807 RepID=Q5CXG6_CRYPI|nr:hypothetical protein [Cryptosporidium parvum Iowa II]QOY40994.1 Uncharacterized protein CPATCC_0012640 [Cryptosporidium parvum]WKS78224.1 hypothetical protein CPCDC_6g1160 [Cryptosporidium sp. 43IA8]EAK89800.1 hypothetical protein cgd6_1160 [Cryptosporidium parvum Iowa II]WRK32713.1 Uncharacterized protein cpbgf_6001160 [Cryptosporidium parvum]CAD98663.1 hypothetical predicted protein, unknown function [Cryptosporidium parvum]|eukprot:QOY40994.1 hypothetical protein CPATCC_002630 [Cryptosporidium parvum]
MRNESVNGIELDSKQKASNTKNRLEINGNKILEENTTDNSGEKQEASKPNLQIGMREEIPETESKKENESNDIGFVDEMIAKALSTRKKKQNSDSGIKLRKVENSLKIDENASTRSQIFTERPFFQRLTDSIYRRLIIGSSNQIKLVGLISAARLLVHLYESNTLEIPQNEEVQYRIPLLNCHVGDWQPVDSDRVVFSKSSISKDLLGCSKAPHAPPLVNRTRNIYIVTPLNYDGNKVGGGYRGGGSDPLSRLVMKWRNLSVSDIQDFTYITENGFDLKYNGFYILYAKSNKPDSQWKQFYSARMRTNAFNSRHQILINSTHLSKLIKLHTVHLQKDGSDLPIGMALFEDHTESLATEDIRKDYSFNSVAEMNIAASPPNERKHPKGIDKHLKTSQNMKDDVGHLLESSKDMELKNLAQTYPGLVSFGNQILKQVNKDTQITTGSENGKTVGNIASPATINGSSVINPGQAFDQNSIFSQNHVPCSNINSNFAKDSLELSLLLNFRSLSTKLQTEILHAISCIKFLNQDMFSAALRSALDAACINNGSLSENGLVSSKGLGLMQPISNVQNTFDKTKNDLPLFIRLLQDGSSEAVLSSGCGNVHPESFMPSNEASKSNLTGYAGIDSANFGFASNIGNALFPMFWSSFLASQQFNNTHSFISDKNTNKIDSFNLNNSVASETNTNNVDNQNDVQTSAISTPVCKPKEK